MSIWRSWRHKRRKPVDDLVSRGAREAGDAGDLARRSDVLILCLPNSEVVEQVVSDMASGFRDGQILVDMGTSSLASTRKTADFAARFGVRFAEAPVTGGTLQAERGELGALVGAEEEVFRTVLPLLQHACSSVQRFGPVGAGGRAKLINNYMVMGIAALVSEAFHMADLTRSDWAKLHDVVIRGSADSGVFRRMIGNAIRGDYKGYVFDVASAAKDMRYVTEMSEALGRNTPLNQAVHAFFTRAESEGYGDLLISELLRPEIRKERDGV